MDSRVRNIRNPVVSQGRSFLPATPPEARAELLEIKEKIKDLIFGGLPEITSSGAFGKSSSNVVLQESRVCFF